MNRYLATSLVALFGALALPVGAQDRGGYGARGEAHNRAVERESRSDRHEERGARKDEGRGRDDRGGYGGQPNVSHGGGNADYGRGGRSERPNHSPQVGSGFHQPQVVNRDDRYRGSGGRHDQHDRGRDHRSDGRHDYRYDNRRDNRHDNRHDSRYNNHYGYTDYRRGLPRTDRRDYDHRYRNDFRNDRHRNDHRRYNSWRDDGWRVTWNHGWNGHRYRAPARYYYPRGYAYQSWRVGYRLPLVFLSSRYYVDYSTYGLALPPYGCRWLRVDGDLLLVEIDSGEIVDILYGFYY